MTRCVSFSKKPKHGVLEHIHLEVSKDWLVDINWRIGNDHQVNLCMHERPIGRIIKNVYNALHAVKGKEGTLLAMSARNEEKDTLILPGSFRGHSKIKIQSVASSAGGTAIMAMVAQPYRGHLNSNVNNEFNMEECYAVAGSCAQSLTVIASSLDTLFFARRPIGQCNLVLLVHHR